MSVLDGYIDELTAWQSLGITQREMVPMLRKNFNIETSKSSIDRAFQRWGLGGHTREVRETTPPAKVNQWGFGGALAVEPAKTKGDEIVVFGSDFHVPFHDRDAVTSFINLVKATKPDRVVLNGDIADFFQLSRFNTSQDRLDTLQQEIDMSNNEIRRAVRSAAPNAIIDETEGNHDNRIRSFVLHNARALSSLRVLEPANLFGYHDLEINWHPGAGFLLRPQFLVKHGTFVRGEVAATAKAELMQAGISGISGHTHRLGTYRRHGYVQRQWSEQGGFMQMDPDYIVGIPNWTQGCCVGEFSTTSDAFLIHEVPYRDGKLRLGLTRY